MEDLGEGVEHDGCRPSRIVDPRACLGNTLVVA